MIKTAEYVSPSHPDKICDNLSDAILTNFLAEDKDSRVAIEVLGGHGKLFIGGEVTTNANVKDSINKAVTLLCPKDVTEIITNVVEQSPDIASGVDGGGAGDQGITVGHWDNTTHTGLTLEHQVARDLVNNLYSKWPLDGKVQVTVGEDVIQIIVISWATIKNTEIKKEVLGWLDAQYPQTKPQLIINPAGEWTHFGFNADTGLTGRKIVQDAYGPHIPVGGGAFSGKDPTKVDRSGAIYARWLAHQICKKNPHYRSATVELAWAIGLPKPVAWNVSVDTNKASGQEVTITDPLWSVEMIINNFHLREVDWLNVSIGGVFGHSKYLWEM
jgi:S-adenosylmethionine synthetase